MKSHNAGVYIAAIAILGGVYLTAKGVPIPPWLGTILTIVGTGGGWLMLPPFRRPKNPALRKASDTSRLSAKELNKLLKDDE